jgi:hypothetical protein
MASPLSSSFIADIIDSLITKLGTDLGSTSGLPTYLQLQFKGRAGGFPHLIVADENTPALWIEYVSGESREGQIGEVYGVMREQFNVFCYVVFTPENIGQTGRDVTNFRKYAEVGIDILMRKVWASLLSWNSSITDSIIGGVTNGANVSAWGFNLTARNDLQLEGRAMMRLDVSVE